MGGVGQRDFGQEIAPFYVLKVEGTKLEADITNFIRSVEFESAVDILDIMKITVANPGFVWDFGGPDFTAHKVFQPGNEVDLWIGYGAPANATYIGRAIVDKHLPRYPENAMPLLEITAYDAAKRMATSAEITTGDRPKRKRVHGDAIGRKYINMTHSEMVEDKAAKYGFAENIYPTEKVDTLFQKKDMKDFDFVRGLAAVNSMDFWIDYDLKLKKWKLNWLPRDYTQRPGYVLDYGQENSAIFRCEAEYGLAAQITDFQVMYFSEKTQMWQRVDRAVTEPGTDLRYRRSATTGTAQTPRKRVYKGRRPVKMSKREKDMVSEEIKNAPQLRLAAGGHSIDVVPNRRFKDASDAIAFAKRWMQTRREHFITLKGECVGIETMLARQVHEVKGLGPRLTGNYYFTSVRHKLGGGQQYRCEFIAHKVLEET